MMAQTKKFHISFWTVISLWLFAFFALFVLYPLVLVLYKSVVDPVSGSTTLAYFTRFFTKPFYWETMVHSMEVTVVSTILAALLGLPMAYLMRSIKIKGSALLNILIVISYLSPPFIGAYAWIQLLGRNGVITQFFNQLFHTSFNGVYGFSGIVLVFTLQSFPLIYIFLSGSLKTFDNSLNEAAESLGCSRFTRMRRILVPLLLPTLLSSSMLVFMRVFADFGTPMLIGEGFKTMPVLVYTSFMGEVGGDDGFAAAICVIMIVLTVVMFFAQRYLANRSIYTMTALKPIVAEKASGLCNIMAHGIVYIVTGLAILPQLVVVYTSFLRSNGGQVFTGGYALQSYEATLFAKDNTVIWNTYFLGIVAIAIVLVMGGHHCLSERTEKESAQQHPRYGDHVPLHYSRVSTGDFLPVCLQQPAYRSEWHGFDYDYFLCHPAYALHRAFQCSRSGTDQQKRRRSGYIAGGFGPDDVPPDYPAYDDARCTGRSHYELGDHHQ